MTYSPPPFGTNPPPPGGMPIPGGMGGYGIEHPKGTTILVLGILGLVCCGPCGIAAWVMGNSAIKEIDANPGAYTNRGTVNAGRICGMVATILMVAGVLIYGLLLVLGVAVGGFSTDYS